jgi:hypothetical protein
VSDQKAKKVLRGLSVTNRKESEMGR